MRKLFRFRYEPCNKTCYAYCHYLPLELNKMGEKGRQEVVNLMVDAHAKLCDNPEYSFGVDMDEKIGVFVAYFRTPNTTETFVNMSFGNCVREVCQRVMETTIPKVDGVCGYGDNGAEDLGAEILRACVDNDFREKHHRECPCHLAAHKQERYHVTSGFPKNWCRVSNGISRFAVSCVRIANICSSYLW